MIEGLEEEEEGNEKSIKMKGLNHFLTNIWKTAHFPFFFPLTIRQSPWEDDFNRWGWWLFPVMVIMKKREGEGNKSKTSDLLFKNLLLLHFNLLHFLFFLLLFLSFLLSSSWSNFFSFEASFKSLKRNQSLTTFDQSSGFPSRGPTRPDLRMPKETKTMK